MNVVDFIRSEGLVSLREKYGISVREYEDRYVLNYSQIDSPKYDPIVRECRALILRKSDLRILSRSFDRFYNIGEGTNTNLNMRDYIAFEKLDGSIINFYHDENSWCCSSKSMAFAEGLTPLGNTYSSVVERALGVSIQEFGKTHLLDTYHTYIFELTSPENRVVTPYRETKLFLLSVREKETGEYIGRSSQWHSQNKYYDFPKSYRFSTMEECMSSSRELKNLEEGYVLYDGFNIPCVKVKNPSYLAVAHLRGNGGLSTNKIIDLIFEQDEEEYLSMFPEDRQFFQPYIDAYKFMIYEIYTTFEKYKNIQDQKEFASYVKDSNVSQFMFMMKKGMKLENILKKVSDSTKHQTINKFKRG